MMTTWGRHVRDPRMVDVDDDLLWYFQARESEMGVHASELSQTGPCAFACDAFASQLVGDWVSPPPPSKKERAAAKREAFIRPILKRLGNEHEVPLACAYSHPFANWMRADKFEKKAGGEEFDLSDDVKAFGDLAVYGVAVGAVVRVLCHHGYDPKKRLRGQAQALADETGDRVRTAQIVFDLERMHHRRRLRNLRNRLEERKSLIRAAYLAELTGESAREVQRVKAKALLASYGIEVEG